MMLQAFEKTMNHTGLTEGAYRTDAVLGYTVLRLALGMSIMLHGMSRFIAGLGSFAEHTIPLFSNTILPHALVVPTVYAIPFAESIVGTLIFFGIWTRYALVANACVMLLLIFGTCLRQDWTTLATQMPYPIIIYLLLFTRAFNTISVDGLLARRR
jgi:thiosulfate dehydrogenase (quinone) large subunit